MTMIHDLSYTRLTRNQTPKLALSNYQTVRKGSPEFESESTNPGLFQLRAAVLQKTDVRMTRLAFSSCLDCRAV